MAKMGHPFSYKEMSEMMNHADTDGDGVLSFHEFAIGQIHRQVRRRRCLERNKNVMMGRWRKIQIWEGEFVGRKLRSRHHNRSLLQSIDLLIHLRRPITTTLTSDTNLLPILDGENNGDGSDFDELDEGEDSWASVGVKIIILLKCPKYPLFKTN
ncbi:Probable calcium-binding protein CML16 [Linum grandiflorum]